MYPQSPKACRQPWAALLASCSLVVGMCLMHHNARAELIGHWTLDDGLSDPGALVAVDSSEKGHDGDLVDFGFEPVWISGGDAVFGGAIDLEGEFGSIEVDMGDDLPIGADPRTITAWINAPLTHQAMFFSYGGAGNGHQFSFTLEDHDGTPHIWLRHNGGNIRYPGAVVEEWMHVAAVVPDGAEFTSDVRVYINGEVSEGVRGSGEDRVLDTLEDFFNIGNRYGRPENRAFEGQIDDVWFFDEELTQSEIQAIMAGGGGGGTALKAGDSDMDLDFDQLDLVTVQIAAKYLSGQPATWGEGDWDGAPGGEPGSPPPGDGTFNQLDIISALGTGNYLTGPYGAVSGAGLQGDARTSIMYDANTGEVAVDAPVGSELTSVNIDSVAGVFTASAAQNLGGSFDNDADNNIFKATFGGSFGSLSFGNVAQPGLEEQFLLSDLTVVGSLSGGGALGDVDLIYVAVPEPTMITLLLVGLITAIACRRNGSKTF